MKELTCVIIGGGHAGIHAAKGIWKATRERSNTERVRLILIDKQPYHVRKVLLFMPAVGGEGITVPWSRVLQEGVQFVQGAVTLVESDKKQLLYLDAEGDEARLNYDVLVVAVGSVVRHPDAEQGGIALTDLETAAHIKERWQANFQKAVTETDTKERERLLTVAVAGAGITGIEASVELAHAMRKEGGELGLDPKEVRVFLLNAQDRLFQEGPAKVGRRLEDILRNQGVTVLHHHKVLREKHGQLILSNGESMSVGLCIWTLGLLPNPMLQYSGLPLTPEGKIDVDECYRVKGAPGVYGIGDCARIVDPKTGLIDQMTCKEGIPQAIRLSKIIEADLKGRPAPVHKSVPTAFAIGLGPEQGLVWARYWGIDFIMSGKLGWKIKKYGWDHASLLK